MAETALSPNHWTARQFPYLFIYFFFNNWKIGLWAFLQDQFYMSQGFVCKMFFSLFLNRLPAHFWPPLSFKSLAFVAAGLFGAKRMTGMWNRDGVMREVMGGVFVLFFYFFYPFNSRTILILDSLECIFLFVSDSARCIFCSVPVSRMPKWSCSLSPALSFLSHFFPSLLAFYFK